MRKIKKQYGDQLVSSLKAKKEIISFQYFDDFIEDFTLPLQTNWNIIDLNSEIHSKKTMSDWKYGAKKYDQFSMEMINVLGQEAKIG